MSPRHITTHSPAQIAQDRELRLLEALPSKNPVDTYEFPVHRDFGVELEYYGLSLGEAADAVVAALGGKKQERSDGSFIVEDVKSRPWHIKPDDSCPVEVASPRLSAWSDVALVQRVARFMKAAGSIVKGRDGRQLNVGMHVHTDASDLTPANALSLSRTSFEHGPLLDELLSVPGIRRPYCAQFEAMPLLFLAHSRPANRETMFRAMEKAGTLQKNKAINFGNFVKPGGIGTFEYRSFNGTHSANKIGACICLALASSDTAARQNAFPAAFVDGGRIRKGRSVPRMLRAFGLDPESGPGAYFMRKAAQRCLLDMPRGYDNGNALAEERSEATYTLDGRIEEAVEEP